VSFKWNVLENALFYEVDVVDLEGNPMWSARVDTSETPVPPSVTLPEGQYFVVVRAVMADGKLTSSKFVQFSIR
jgi:methionine-rich copper-binding protein CopC